MRHTRSKHRGLKQHRRRRTIRRRNQRGGAEEFLVSDWLKAIKTDAVNGGNIINMPIAAFTTANLPEIPHEEWSTAAYFLVDGQEGDQKLNLFMAGVIVKTIILDETVQDFMLSVNDMEQEDRDQLLMIENALRKTAGRSDLITDLTDKSKYPLLIWYLANATSDTILNAYTPVLGPAV